MMTGMREKIEGKRISNQQNKHTHKKTGKLTMMFAVASKTLQQITTARRETTRSFAAASEKVWKVYLSGT
jgi:deferrochelatase/peroxidase EfeB